MQSRYRQALAYGLFLLFCAHSVIAQNDSPLTLQAAVEAALQSNPGLRLYPLREAALRGEREVAALAQPFQLNTTLEDALGTGNLRGVAAAELTLSLSHVVEFGGKREARSNAVGSKLAVLEAERRVEQLDLMAEVARQFIAVASEQQRVALRQRAVQLAQLTLGNVQTLVESAQVPAAEQLRATAALAQAVLEQGHAEAALQVARLQLAGLWASQRPEFSTVSAELLQVGDAGEIDTLLIALADNPELRVFASEERMQQAALTLAQSGRRTNLQWNAGIRHLSEAGDTGFVVGVSMPLGNTQRASGAIAIAQAELEQVAGRRTEALNRLSTQLRVLHIQLAEAIEETNGLREQVLPLLNEALEQTRTAYLGGRYDFLELAAAQREVLATEQALIDAATTAHLLRAEIERLAGVALEPINAE